MEMDDSSSPAADFVDYLGPDTSATVFTMIHHPADLARASAVSRSWRQFVIDNHFTKLQCLRACPEVSTFTAVDVTTSRRTTLQDQDQHSAAQSNTTAENLHRVYSHLAHGLLSPYNPRDCILHCIGASSTDNFPEETVENTLEPVDQLDTSRPSYWSSGGQRDPDAAECLIYRLQADLCLIHEIKVQPFKAFFQHGDPIYSPKSIRVQMGYPRSPLRPEALVSDENEGQLIHDTNYVWTYTSPEFPMLQVSPLNIRISCLEEINQTADIDQQPSYKAEHEEIAFHPSLVAVSSKCLLLGFCLVTSNLVAVSLCCIYVNLLSK